MGHGVTRSIALRGLVGVRVMVEADIAPGLPRVNIVGMPDAAVRQAQHRTWSAIHNSQLETPETRVVINLTPASVPKAGSMFDLGIAMALLMALRVVPSSPPADTVVLGELGLDGRLRPLAGVLPMVRAAALDGAAVVVVPTANVDEASLVEGVRVVGVASLRDAAIRMGADLEPIPVEPIMHAERGGERDPVPDLSDVIGNEPAVEALQLAAAGRHHMFMLGPPGAGKTMLASRLPGLLPDLDVEQALDVASLRSLIGEPPGASLDRTPPFEAPHHSATAASLVGGGGATIRPGSAARASHGVLFLDECAEFASSVLDMLRQPLESRRIAIHRASATAEYPASFQLVLAANPCPCGQYGSGQLGASECRCTPQQRRTYLSKLSGPLLDRVDLHVHVDAVSAAAVAVRRESGGGTTTASARERVLAARDRAAHRLRDTPWRVNGDVPGPWFRQHARLSAETTEPIDVALSRGAITMRGYDRIVRAAFTICDLDEASQPTRAHIGRALFYRRGIAA